MADDSLTFEEERSREKEFDVLLDLPSRAPLSDTPFPPLPLLSPFPFLSTCDEFGEKRGECRAVAVAIITRER